MAIKNIIGRGIGFSGGEGTKWIVTKGLLTVVGGSPFVVEAGQIYTPGAVIGEIFTPGATKGEIFTPGATAGQVA